MILFGLCGHGHFDLAAYDAYLAGELEDPEFSEADMEAALGAAEPGVLEALRGTGLSGRGPADVRRRCRCRRGSRRSARGDPVRRRSPSAPGLPGSPSRSTRSIRPSHSPGPASSPTWWTPRAASVAKASVISSGETPSGPEGRSSRPAPAATRMPIRCAASTTACGPTFMTTCAKIVLTENAVAWSSDIVPCASSA